MSEANLASPALRPGITNYKVRSPTGLERLARLLAATKEDAAAEISMLRSQAQALEVERRTLQAELESCRDQLGDANSLVEQLRLENTRKWRVEERDDWRALLESMQTDRNVLQQQTARLETELTRCVAALRSIFPPATPRGSAAGVESEAGVKRGKRVDVPPCPANGRAHPPELTYRTGSGRRSNVTVDLEWLDALAEELNVAYEGVDDDPGEGDDGTASGETLGEDSACAKLRLELDALKSDSEIKCLALERRVREQEQELRLLRKTPSRKAETSPHGTTSAGTTAAQDGAERGIPPAPTSSGMFQWWRRDGIRAAASASRDGRTAKALSSGTSARVTVV